MWIPNGDGHVRSVRSVRTLCPLAPIHSDSALCASCTFAHIIQRNRQGKVNYDTINGGYCGIALAACFRNRYTDSRARSQKEFGAGITHF